MTLPAFRLLFPGYVTTTRELARATSTRSAPRRGEAAGAESVRAARATRPGRLDHWIGLQVEASLPPAIPMRTPEAMSPASV